MSIPLAEPAHRITLFEAVEMTTRYRTQKAAPAANPERSIVLPISETFNRQAFEDLLAQPGCKGIRLYYSMDEAQQLRAVFVAVNEKEEDILPKGEGEGIIIEVGKICPPDCGAASPLNS